MAIALLLVLPSGIVVSESREVVEIKRRTITMKEVVVLRCDPRDSVGQGGGGSGCGMCEVITSSSPSPFAPTSPQSASLRTNLTTECLPLLQP
ncbi:hypothetical protein GYH30_005889 [Glycine max]|nr:hypothetical protein GYH30_005889 [Glycine max]